MVTLGVMSAPSPENAHVAQALTHSRARTRAGIVACVERGVGRGELAVDTNAIELATLFDSFLQGISILARDDMPIESIDAAITLVLLTWDLALATAPALEQS
jgi:hypothetical protein